MSLGYARMQSLLFFQSVYMYISFYKSSFEIILSSWPTSFKQNRLWCLQNCLCVLATNSQTISNNNKALHKLCCESSTHMHEYFGVACPAGSNSSRYVCEGVDTVLTQKLSVCLDKYFLKRIVRLSSGSVSSVYMSCSLVYIHKNSIKKFLLVLNFVWN